MHINNIIKPQYLLLLPQYLPAMVSPKISFYIISSHHTDEIHAVFDVTFFSYIYIEKYDHVSILST